MDFVLPKKYEELEHAILTEQFPIIIHGSSGTGKTHTVNSILRKHNLKSHYIELDRKPLPKLLNRRAVLLTVLHRRADLDLYLDTLNNHRIIIETTLDYIDVPNCTIIHFNRVPARRMAQLGYYRFNGNLFSIFFGIKQEDERVGLFRFLGRIFYRRLKVAELTEDSGHLTVFYREEEKCLRRVSPKKKKSSRVIASSESEECPEVSERYPVCSFRTETILDYIHENMVLFSNTEVLAEFYELLSLTDRNEYGILPLICCITQKSLKPSGVVRFRANSYRNHLRMELNEHYEDEMD